MKLRVYNTTLDPSIWNVDKTIKPDAREHLLKVAEDFYNSTDLQGEIHDILFIGSSANYNWTPTSDIDVHIVIDIADEKINEDYARKFMDSLGSKWNLEHDIEVKGHPVEIYLQDIREPNSNANLSREGAVIYSLFSGKWIQEPKFQKPDIDPYKIRKKFETIKAKTKKLVETNDIEALKELMKSIKNYRNAGLAKGGEFSNENLVFKALRKSGVLETIKDTINKIYDQHASLPENGNMQITSSTPKMVNEVLDKNANLFLGFIKRDNLKVVGTSVTDENQDSDEEYSHQDFQRELGWLDMYDNELIPWRYKKKTNTIYWWMPRQHPTEDERQAVEQWLIENLRVLNPKHQWIAGTGELKKYRDDSHRVD